MKKRKKTPGGEPGDRGNIFFSGNQPTLEEVYWLKRRYCEELVVFGGGRC